MVFLLAWQFDQNKREIHSLSQLPNDDLCTGAFGVVMVVDKVDKTVLHPLLIQHKQRGREHPWWRREQWESVEDCLWRELEEEAGIYKDNVIEYHVVWARKFLDTTPQYIGRLASESYLPYYVVIVQQQWPYNVMDPDGAIIQSTIVEYWWDEINDLNSGTKILFTLAKEKIEELWFTSH